MAYHDEDRPVHDLGVPKPGVPFRAGGKDQGTRATRKNALLDAGPGVGYVPGHSGAGPRSSANAGHVHEAAQPSGPVPGHSGLEYARRPMPREIPYSSEQTHFGHMVRFLDGHTEIHRERPQLLADMNHPDTPDDEREDLRTEIAQRDALHLHTYW